MCIRDRNGVWTYHLDDVWTGLQDAYRKLSDEVCTVMAFFGGPIELVGAPHRDLASQIAGIKRRVAQPVDIMQRAPRTWLVSNGESGSGEKTQMTFSAPAS